MMTSNERREVAARLREAAIDDGHVGRPYGEQGFQVTLRRIIGTSNPMRKTLYARLADLIDTEEEDTCCDVSDDGDAFTCSRCGCAVRLSSAEADSFENVTYGPTLTMPNGRGEKLSFCPNCGARVVGE